MHACMQIKGSSGLLSKITFTGEDADFLTRRMQALEVIYFYHSKATSSLHLFFCLSAQNSPDRCRSTVHIGVIVSFKCMLQQCQMYSYRVKAHNYYCTSICWTLTHNTNISVVFVTCKVHICHIQHMIAKYGG